MPNAPRRVNHPGGALLLLFSFVGHKFSLSNSQTVRGTRVGYLLRRFSKVEHKLRLAPGLSGKHSIVWIELVMGSSTRRMP
uniref:Putative secreted protein n=1 Tax=Ixodes ricinus TaxID=34613 RepID=A0A6B0U6R4_IXORI